MTQNMHPKVRSRFPKAFNPDNPPFKASFSKNLIQDAIISGKRFKNQYEISQYINKKSLSDLNGVPIIKSHPATDHLLALQIASEVVSNLGVEGEKISTHWYTDSIKKMMDIFAIMHPECYDENKVKSIGSPLLQSIDDIKTVLFCALSITSQNIPVNKNMEHALYQYRHFCKHGVFDPVGYGPKGGSVRNNLSRFNMLIEIMGDIKTIREFLSKKFTMGSFREAARNAGIHIEGGELNDEIVYGSMIFGPKIGNGFYQNLIGNYDPVTIDMWMMRSWGRWTGTLIRGEISDNQKQRLIDSLQSKPESFFESCTLNGIHCRPNELETYDNDEILDTCRKLDLLWERIRRQMSKDGKDNKDVVLLKNDLGWPYACQAIIKSLGSTMDAPKNASQRKWMRHVLQKAVTILNEKGYNFDPASLQANCWFREKSILSAFKDRKLNLFLIDSIYNTSYDLAISDIAREEGFVIDGIFEGETAKTVADGFRRYEDVECDGLRI